MIKAILLVFDPANTWDDIVQDRRSVTFMLLVYLLPLLVLTGGAEAYGLLNWGKWLGPIIGLKHFTALSVAVSAGLQLLLNLVEVFMGALILKSLGETFHGRHTYTQALRVVIYGLSPLFLVRLLDVFPSMPWSATWGIGITLSIAILYHGVPRVMQPDPAHALGLYMTSSLLLTMITGLGRFLGAWWTLGKFEKVQAVVNTFVANFIARFH